jgi:hypothetical protein
VQRKGPEAVVAPEVEVVVVICEQKNESGPVIDYRSKKWLITSRDRTTTRPGRFKEIVIKQIEGHRLTIIRSFKHAKGEMERQVEWSGKLRLDTDKKEMTLIPGSKKTKNHL